MINRQLLLDAIKRAGSMRSAIWRCTGVRNAEIFDEMIMAVKAVLDLQGTPETIERGRREIGLPLETPVRVLSEEASQIIEDALEREPKELPELKKMAEKYGNLNA